MAGASFTSSRIFSNGMRSNSRRRSASVAASSVGFLQRKPLSRLGQVCSTAWALSSVPARSNVTVNSSRAIASASGEALLLCSQSRKGRRNRCDEGQKTQKLACQKSQALADGSHFGGLRQWAGCAWKPVIEGGGSLRLLRRGGGRCDKPRAG